MIKSIDYCDRCPLDASQIIDMRPHDIAPAIIDHAIIARSIFAPMMIACAIFDAIIIATLAIMMQITLRNSRDHRIA